MSFEVVGRKNNKSIAKAKGQASNNLPEEKELISPPPSAKNQEKWMKSDDLKMPVAMKKTSIEFKDDLLRSVKMKTIAHNTSIAEICRKALEEWDQMHGFE